MIKTNWIYNCLLFRSTITELEPDILQILGYTGEGMDGLIPHFLVFFISFGGSLWMLVIYIRVCWRICPQVWAPKRNPRWKTFPVFWEMELSSNNIKKELYLRKYNPTLPSSSPKNKKYPPCKKLLIFPEMGLSNSNIKKILIFSQKKAFLTFPEMEPYTFHTKSTPHPHPKKEPNPGKLTYTSGNRSPKILKGNLQSLKIKKLLCIFLERTQVFQIILIFFRSIIVFSILKKLSFFIFWEIFVTFTTILLLFFFFFFRKVLIPFSSFFCIFVVFLYFFDNT